MKSFRNLCAVLALTLAALPFGAQAEFPERTLRIVVPYQAGGSTDTVVRKFAELAAPELGQAIIIENRGGAGATLGARALATAQPDGYTLAILPSPVFRMPHIQDMGYDPLRDFTYVMMMSGYTLGVAVPVDAPYKNWAEFIAYAKAHPGDIAYGTASVGSASNVMMEQIATANGVSWRHIPYKGESEVIQGILGGQLQAYAGSTTVLPMVQSGKLRMLVTWGERRSAQFPGVPTLHELDGSAPAYAPFGIAAPKGLPEPVRKKLHDTFKRVAESEAFKTVLTQYGQELVYLDGPAYAAYAKEQFAAEAKIVKDLGLANK